MQNEVFSPPNLALKYMWSSEIWLWSTEADRTKLRHTELDHVESYLSLHGQIVVWDLHSYLPTLQDNL